MRHSKLLRSLAGLLIMAVIVIFARHHGVELSKGSKSRAQKTKANATASTNSPQAYRWEKGASATYEIQYQVAIEKTGSADWAIDAGGGVGGTTVKGRVCLLVLEVAPSVVTLAWQGSGLTVVSDGHGNPILEDLFNQTPQILRLSPNGQLLSRSFPANLATQDRNMLAGLSHMQWTLGEGAAWSAKEIDLMGSYVCSYTRNAASGTMGKHRRMASQNDAVMPSVVRFELAESNFTATLGSFWLETLSGTERAAFVHEGKPISSINTTLKMARRHESTSLPDSLKALTGDGALAQFTEEKRDASKDQVDASSASERQRMARLREQYGQVPFEQILQGALDSFRSAKEHAETIPAIEALRDWLLVHPEEANKMADALKDASLNDQLTARLVHALELAGRETPQAQDALGDILQNRAAYPDATVLQAIVASGAIEQIQSPKIFAGLRDIIAQPAAGQAEDFQRNDAALYAVGALAEKNPQAKQALVEALAPRLQDPNTYAASDLVVALDGLANGRVVEPSLEQSSRALANHADPSVRAAALDYLHRGYPQDFSPAMNAMKDDNQVVQAHAVAALADPETATPASIQFLQQQLGRGDLSSQVKETITGALTHHSELAAR